MYYRYSHAYMLWEFLDSSIFIFHLITTGHVAPTLALYCSPYQEHPPKIIALMKMNSNLTLMQISLIYFIVMTSAIPDMESCHMATMNNNGKLWVT